MTSKVLNTVTVGKGSSHLSSLGPLRVVGILLMQYPQRSLLVLVAMFVAGLAEGIGLVTLLPLFELLIEGGMRADSKLGSSLIEGFDWIGLKPSVGNLLVIIVFFISIKAVLIFFAMNHIGGVLAQMAAELRIELLRSILGARWGFFVRHPIGRFVNSVITEAPRATSTYRATCQFLAAGMQASILLVIALFVAPELTIASILVGILLMFLLGHFVTMARQAGRKMVGLMQSLTSRLTDGLQGIKALKAMNCERWLIPMLERETYEMRKTVRRQVLAKYGLAVFREPIIVAIMATGMYFALLFSKFQIAELLTLVVLFYRTTGNFGQIQEAFQQIGASEHFYWSIRNLTDLAASEPEVFEGKSTPVLQQKIEMRNVDFSYNGKPVLKRVSLELQPFTFTVVIGSSGSGKTTIADLLCGLLHPGAGDILIDGTSLSNIDIRKWRRGIGYVPQDFFLFHDSVLKNVTLGDPSIDETAVEEALQNAGAMDFVSQLSDGIHTVVGERGIMISGGQRQRIAIARALVRKPMLLILDEATTALDPNTEKSICRGLRELSRKVTIFAISHQPAMVELADQVYSVDNGHIELMKNFGTDRRHG